MVAFDGVCPVVPTPFTPDGEVAPDQYRRIVEFLIDGGCDGAMLFGTHSEVHKLTADERSRLLDAAVAVAGDELPLAVSIPERSTEVAVRRAREAAAAGAARLVVVPPSHLDPSPEDQFAHVERVADAVDVPVVVQYAPDTAGGALSVDFLVELYTEVDGVESFKVESVPPGPVVEALAAAAPGATVFDGLAGLRLVESLDRGAGGVMPGCGLHDVYRQIIAAYRSGRRDRSRRLHAELVPFLNHVRQTAEMLVYYEKEVLRRRGVIESTARRSPNYSPDDRNDALFEEYYADLAPRLEH